MADPYYQCDATAEGPETNQKQLPLWAGASSYLPVSELVPGDSGKGRGERLGGEGTGEAAVTVSYLVGVLWL